MGAGPVTVAAYSVYRHDLSIDLEFYNSDTALQETTVYGVVIIFMELSKETTNIAFP